MANPTLLKTPIASGGDKNTIPETTGSTTGLLSQEKGWQQINSLPINAGGIAPSRLDFNGVFNLLSNILFYTQKGWQWEFDETQNYFAGCTVKDTADGKTYVCIADVSASTTHPSSDTTHWKLSDLATKDDLANYLPLAGGHLTGSYPIIDQNIDTGAILLMSGKSGTSEGASIQLNAPNRSGNPGYFDLIAKGGNAFKILRGTPDGTLTWDGSNVVTDANGGYLPLSGGAMTGSTISRNVNNDLMYLTGGSSTDNGAYIQLNGNSRSNSAGAFYMVTSVDASHYNALIGKPTGVYQGELLWGNDDLGGSAIVAKSLGTTGYVKFASGEIRQWGVTTSTTSTSVTFPISFSGTPIVLVSPSNNADPYAESITANGFTAKSNTSTTISWFAIGV